MIRAAGRGRLLPILLPLLTVGALAACTSTAEPFVAGEPTIVSTPTVAAVATAVPPTTAPSETGEMTVSTDQGDKLDVTLAFSDLVPPGQVPDLAECGIDTSRALAERMDVTASVQSSLPAEVTISWNPDIDYAPASEVVGVYLISEYSTGPSCDEIIGSTDLNVHWAAIQPGSPGHFTGYWIFTQAVSPANPDGDRQGLGQIFLQPQAVVSQSAASVGYSGERYVQCAQPEGLGSEGGFYLAGDRPTRLVAGGLSEDLTCD